MFVTRLHAEELLELKTKAESATTKDEFDKYKEQYEETYGDYERAQSFNIVATSTTPNRDPKDPSEWRAGGFYRQESYAGGVYWSPTRTGYIANKPKIDFGMIVKTGAFYPFLNKAWGQVNSVLNSYKHISRNYQREDRHEVRVVTIEVQAGGQSFTNDVTISSSPGDGYSGTHGGGTTVSTKNGNISTQDMSSLDTVFNGKAHSNFSSILGQKANIGLNISIAAYDQMTGESVKAGDRIGSMMYSMSMSKISEAIGMEVAKGLGLKSIHGAIGSIFAVGELLQETVEVMTGYDRSFGFGGEYAGQINGENAYSKAPGFGQSIADIAAEIASFGMAETQTFNSTGFTDADGNTIAGTEDYTSINNYDDGTTTFGISEMDMGEVGFMDSIGQGMADFGGSIGDAIGDFGAAIGGAFDAIGDTLGFDGSFGYDGDGGESSANSSTSSTGVGKSGNRGGGTPDVSGVGNAGADPDGPGGGNY